MNIIDDVKSYEENGYLVLKGALPKPLLDNLELEFSHLVKMQLTKAGIHVPSDANIDELVTTLDQHSFSLLQEAIMMLRSTRAAFALLNNDTLKAYCDALLKSDIGHIISGPSMLVNQPGKSTRKYTAHAEQTWYPKRQNFLNIWTPFIKDRVSHETIRIWKGSHLKDWFYFSEYTGYDEKNDKFDNIQYEIPNAYLKDFPAHDIEDMAVGDIVIFSPKLVHASLDTREDISYAFSIRAFDYRQDLTFSANWAEVPFGQSKTARVKVSEDFTCS